MVGQLHEQLEQERLLNKEMYLGIDSDASGRGRGAFHFYERLTRSLL